MNPELKSQCNSKTNQPRIEHSIETCTRCSNEYIVIWIKESENFNDFGDRFCPFCGLMTEVFFIREKT